VLERGSDAPALDPTLLVRATALVGYRLGPVMRSPWTTGRPAKSEHRRARVHTSLRRWQTPAGAMPAEDYPGFGTARCRDPATYPYTLDRLSRRSTTQCFPCHRRRERGTTRLYAYRLEKTNSARNRCVARSNGTEGDGIMALHDQSQRTRAPRRRRRRHAAALGPARRARHDRHEIRVRDGAVRRCTVHIDGPQGVPHHHDPAASHGADHHDRGRSAGRRRARRFRRLLDHEWCSRLLPVGTDHVASALLASNPIRATPTVDDAMSGNICGAGPMCASAKRSSSLRRRTKKEADHDLGTRPALLTSPVAAQLPHCERRGTARADAEPASRSRRSGSPRASRRMPSSASTADGQVS